MDKMKGNLNATDLCDSCHIKYPERICNSCKSIFCGDCAGKHIYTGHRLIRLPPCETHKYPSSYYCENHYKFLCHVCAHEHRSCNCGRLNKMDINALGNTYNETLRKLSENVSNVLTKQDFFKEIDQREQQLEESRRRAEDDIHKAFRALRESLDRREYELIEELNRLHKEKSLRQTKDEIIKFCSTERRFLDGIYSNPPRDFIETLGKMGEIVEKNDILTQIGKQIPKEPRVLVAKVDPSFIKGGDFSNWGKIECRKATETLDRDEDDDMGMDDDDIGTSRRGGRGGRRVDSNDYGDRDRQDRRFGGGGGGGGGGGKYINESDFKAMKKSKKFKGEFRARSYTLSSFTGGTEKMQVWICNTGGKNWDCKWDICQVGGDKLENFLPQKFSPRTLNGFANFDIFFYLSFERGVHKSGCYKFAVIDRDRNEKITEPLCLTITLSDGDGRGRGGRRGGALPEFKVPQKNRPEDVVGEYRFKKSWEIDNYLGIT